MKRVVSNEGYNINEDYDIEYDITTLHTMLKHAMEHISGMEDKYWNDDSVEDEIESVQKCYSLLMTCDNNLAKFLGMWEK